MLSSRTAAPVEPDAVVASFSLTFTIRAVRLLFTTTSRLV
jgi:hypothetical protein